MAAKPANDLVQYWIFWWVSFLGLHGLGANSPVWFGIVAIMVWLGLELVSGIVSEVVVSFSSARSGIATFVQ